MNSGVVQITVIAPQPVSLVSPAGKYGLNIAPIVVGDSQELRSGLTEFTARSRARISSGG